MVIIAVSLYGVLMLGLIRLFITATAHKVVRVQDSTEADNNVQQSSVDGTNVDDAILERINQIDALMIEATGELMVLAVEKKDDDAIEEILNGARGDLRLVNDTLALRLKSCVKEVSVSANNNVVSIYAHPKAEAANQTFD